MERDAESTSDLRACAGGNWRDLAERRRRQRPRVCVVERCCVVSFVGYWVCSQALEAR